jgi:hypothetical protein
MTAHIYIDVELPDDLFEDELHDKEKQIDAFVDDFIGDKLQALSDIDVWYKVEVKRI